MNLFVKKEHVIPLHVTGFTETNGKNATFSSTSSLTCTPAFKISPDITFDSIHNFYMENPTINRVTHTLEMDALALNCWGYAKNLTFANDVEADGGVMANPIRVGNYNGNATKAWLPFTIDFGTQTKGIRIVSAKLAINLFEPTAIPDSTKPCKIKFGVEKVINPEAPGTWTALNARIMSTSYGTFPVVSSLAEGYTHELDLTTLLTDVFGSYGITWTNEQKIAIILQDFGSYTNQHLAITSFSGQYDHPDFSSPKLVIVYEESYYGKNFLSTWISSDKPNECHPQHPQMFIGKPSGSTVTYRSLLRIDLSSIPTTAVITSASLRLFLESKKMTRASTFILLHKFVADKNWDMNTASWNRKYGTELWDSGAGALPDCVSPEFLAQSYALADKTGYLSFDIGSTVQSWVSDPTTNQGMLIKTSNESNDGLTFTSKWVNIDPWWETVDPNIQKPKLIVSYTYSGSTYTNIEIN